MDVKTFNERVLHHFCEISKIPRRSGNEQAAADYVEDFAKNLSGMGVTVHRQKGQAGNKRLNNVIVYKQGMNGGEKSPATAIQAHLDMVCKAEEGVAHDFEKDPIDVIIDGDRIYAKGTTLGADNGIGVAFIMAMLESTDLKHPPIEGIFTSDEEDGMSGVSNLEIGRLTAKRLINIDAEEEKTFFCGCAGSLKADINVPLKLTDYPQESVTFMITISGLLGGHSGLEIHKKRANANRLMGDLLRQLRDCLSDKKTELNLIHICGGDVYNAITDRSEALVAVRGAAVADLQEKIKEIAAVYKMAYSNETNMDIKVESHSVTAAPKVMDQATLDSIIKVICGMPDGVIDMSRQMPGLVETSSNMGAVKQDDTCVSVCCMIRSFVQSKLSETADGMEKVAADAGAVLTRGDESPAWDINPHSQLRVLFEETYVKVFGEAAASTAIHAGLECGFFAQKIPDMDLIAVGPDITGAHSPKETLYIKSLEKVNRLLQAVLAEL